MKQTDWQTATVSTNNDTNNSWIYYNYYTISMVRIKIFVIDDWWLIGKTSKNNCVLNWKYFCEPITINEEKQINV